MIGAESDEPLKHRAAKTSRRANFSARNCDEDADQ
jgi:hypothetical protein